jgi:transcription antitermination factor NusG
MLERAPETETAETNEWFVFRVRPRHEKTVALQLRDKDQHCFLPLLKLKREWGKRIASVELPLFPGYVYCRADRKRLLPIMKTPGVIDVLRAGGAPACVDRSEVEDIEKVIACDGRIEPCPYVAVGEKVRIITGPFTGLCGYLLEVRNGQRLILSVTLVQRSVLVEIDTAAVLPVSQPYSHTELARCEAAL